MPVGTILPEGQTQHSTVTLLPATSTATFVIPSIPITGDNVVSLQCQFCVDGETHAVLVFPELAYFDVISSSTPVRCLTADVVSDRRILICRGAQSTSFYLNICYDSSHCLQFPVALQECPLVTFTPFAPFNLTPINTPESPDEEEPTQASPAVSATPTQRINPTPTSPPPATIAPPTSPPTNPPPPTSEPTTEPEPTNPPATEEPKPTKKPTKTPKPTKVK
jgi:hypothetical protein